MLRYSSVPSEQLAAWFPEERKWPMEDLFENGPDRLLVVFFMNYCPKEWKYCGDIISPHVIMDIVKSTWRRCFIIGEEAWSHVRVTFQGM